MCPSLIRPTACLVEARKSMGECLTLIVVIDSSPAHLSIKAPRHHSNPVFAAILSDLGAVVFRERLLH